MGLFDLFSNDTAEQAALQRNAGLQAGYNDLSGQYQQGRDVLSTGFNNASNAYSSLLNSANAGGNAYGDATGANGAAGFARAKTNFQTDPGYQFQMDQGQQALNRSHAAAGNLASGNADADTLKYSQGLADQSYGNYVSRLAPYLGQQNTATAGYGNAQTGLAQGLNQSYQGQGNAANQNQTAQGASTAAATMNNYNIGANQLGALTGVGSLISGAMGGGLFSGLMGGSGGGTPGTQIGGTSGPATYGGPNGPTPLFGTFA